MRKLKEVGADLASLKRSTPCAWPSPKGTMPGEGSPLLLPNQQLSKSQWDVSEEFLIVMSAQNRAWHFLEHSELVSVFPLSNKKHNKRNDWWKLTENPSRKGCKSGTGLSVWQFALDRDPTAHCAVRYGTVILGSTWTTSMGCLYQLLTLK